jgi:hypothetical protein
MAQKITIADVQPLIEPKRGNVSAIARVLRVSRGTVWNRIQESPTLQRLLEDARESMLDTAESVLYDKVEQGETASLIFFLKTQGYKRGYKERHELEHSGDLTFKVIYGSDGTDNQAS